MITEDQLEQLAIQWFQDTGAENIEHSSSPRLCRTSRTPNMERRSEEKRNLAEALRTLTPTLSKGEKEKDWRLEEAVRIFGSRQISRQSVARGVVGYRDINRNIMSRFGGDSGRKWGIATEIPTMGLHAVPEETRATVKHFLRVRLERRLNP